MTTDVRILQGGSIKVGDTYPPLRIKCLDEAGDPFNLDGFTATIKLRRSDSDNNKVDSQMTIEQAGRGIVKYDWQSGDTDTSGVFEGEVNSDDGSETATFPNRGFFEIHIQEGL